MPIAALSSDVVRQLGSSVAIATPLDLVKELVENAIDAAATSIDVLVSANTLDRIEVRDNGHGIHQRDYDALGRPARTSKITTFKDLHTLGGATLGFRGQALASANTLGMVTVTTRTADEATAWALQLVFGVGGVETQKRTSGPIGTTVSVRYLFKHLPVRQQVAIRDASKTIPKIKQMLYAYVLARPQVRLSFKILGPGCQQPWCYSPRPQATVKEAIIQVFGTDVMSQCLFETTSGRDKDDGTPDGKHFTIEAVLPKPGQLFKGSYFAVDSRPVSSHRGTAKLLLASFKAHLSDSALGSKDPKALKNSLLCVNIRCPPGSYDPNIEPSKNDVSFTCPSTIIELFERLCQHVYQEQPPTPLTFQEPAQIVDQAQMLTPPPSDQNIGHPKSVISYSNTQTSRRESTETQNSHHTVHRESLALPTTSNQQKKDRGWLINMSADPDDSSDQEFQPSAAHSDVQIEQEDSISCQDLNPWTIAQLVAPARQSVNIAPAEVSDAAEHGEITPSLDKSFDETVVSPTTVLGHPGSTFSARTLSPRPSPQRNRLPELRRIGANESFLKATLSPHQGLELLALRSHTTPNHLLRPSKCHGLDLVEYGGPDRPAPASISLGASSFPNSRRPQTRKVTTINPNPLYRKPRSNTTKKPRLPTTESQSGQECEEYATSGRRQPGSGLEELHLVQPRLPSAAPSTYDIRSFMTVNAPVRLPNVSETAEKWEDGDARRYLIRRRCSQAAHREADRVPLKRVKTEMLPLENSPEDDQIQRLVLQIVVPADSFQGVVSSAVSDINFCADSQAHHSLSNDMDLETATDVEARLKKLLGKWSEKALNVKADKVALNLRTIVKGKGVPD